MAEKKAPKNKREVPMSEDQRKFHDWSKEQCIEELRRIAKIDPDKVVSRNYFRVHSVISESTWNRHFGTFHEFKRAAGIVLTRHQHALERHIAKHASKDVQRDLMREKTGWEGRFLKPTGRRFQTVLVGSDQHDIHCDPFYRRLFIETARRVQPDVIVLDGDLFDLTEFSKYTQDPREFGPVKRIGWVHAFLSDLREVCPDAEIHLVEGNHEFRLIRHLAEATPALMTVLSDLHGMTIPGILGLDRFGVNYTARMDLAAFHEKDIKDELRKNYLVLWNSLMLHHFPEGFDFGLPGVNGHHHKHHVKASYSPLYGPYEWHQIGCGHRRAANYCAAEKWSNGFILAHVDTQRQRTVFDYIDCTNEHAVIGGEWYQRKAGE